MSGEYTILGVGVKPCWIHPPRSKFPEVVKMARRLFATGEYEDVRINSIGMFSRLEWTARRGLTLITPPAGWRDSRWTLKP